MIKDRRFFSKIGKKGIRMRWERYHSQTKLPRGMTKEKASIHAYLCGDGSICIRKSKDGRKHYEIRFFPDDSSMLKNICDCFEKYSGIKIRNVKKIEKMYYARLNNKVICKDLLKLGRYGTYDWNIPLEIKKNFSRVWLSCFFDCEAYVDKKSKRIQLKSVNKKGLFEVERMLEGAGIFPQIYGPYKQRRGGSDYFVLIIGAKENLKKFYEKIDFNHSEKHKKLLSILNSRPDGPMVRRK